MLVLLLLLLVWPSMVRAQVAPVDGNASLRKGLVGQSVLLGINPRSLSLACCQSSASTDDWNTHNHRPTDTGPLLDAGRDTDVAASKHPDG